MVFRTVRNFFPILFIPIVLNVSEIHAAPLLRGMNVGPEITAEDISELCDWGANAVRYQLVSASVDNAPLSDYESFLFAALDELDSKLSLFNACGIKVYIDMHTPPGGIDMSAAGNPHAIFVTQSYQEAFLSYWQAIAERYAGNSQIYGYIPVSEPRVPQSLSSGLLNWKTLAQEVAEVIRDADPAHVINIMAPYGDQARFSQIKKIRKVKRVVYGFDFYYPAEYTKQGVEGIPAPQALPSNLRRKILNRLKAADKFKRRYRVVLEVLEFAVVRYAPDANVYLDTLIAILEEKRFGGFYHAFRESTGVFDVELGSDQSNVERLPLSDGEAVLRSYFSKN